MCGSSAPDGWPALGQPSPDPAAAFLELGAAALGPVLDERELAEVRTAFAAAVSEYGVTGGYASIVHDAWRVADVLSGLVPRLGTLACRVAGLPELVLFHDHLIFKTRAGDDMAWHQDFSYLPIDRPDGVTLWVALDDILEDNGCLYYAFGTHLRGERRAAWGLTGDDDPRAKLPPIDIDADGGVAAPTGAGCALAHHNYLWHRSPGNRTDRLRRAWALTFVVPEARWCPSHSPHPRSAVSPRHEGQPLEPDLLHVSS